MRSDAPPLLPILRSRTQAGVLTVLLLNPELELSQTELAERLGAALTSVIDEVRRLERAGILASRSVGRTRLIRAGESILVGPLTELVVRAFGPVEIVGEEFAELAARTEVVGLAVFGSWAARYLGEAGPDPADIDVLVVLEDAAMNRELIYAAADRAGVRLGRPVNPTVVTAARWGRRGHGEDPFLDEVVSRPIVAVPVVDEAT
jgi:DNA-binding Lrp family transcriptional regulator